MSIPRLATKEDNVKCSMCGERALFIDHIDPYHTELSRCKFHLTKAMQRCYIAELERRLADEIDWGHARCDSENCVSSGVDCPKARG